MKETCALEIIVSCIAVLFVGTAILHFPPSRNDSGRILQKNHEPPRRIFCNGRYYLDDEDYIITFESRIDLQRRKAYVTEQAYDSLRIGDEFDATIPHETSDPYTPTCASN